MRIKKIKAESKNLLNKMLALLIKEKNAKGINEILISFCVVQMFELKKSICLKAFLIEK